MKNYKDKVKKIKTNTYDSRDLLNYIISKLGKDNIKPAKNNNASSIRLHIDCDLLEKLSSEFFEILSNKGDVYWSLGGNISNVLKIDPSTLSIKFYSNYNSNNQLLYNHGNNYKLENPQKKRISGKYPWYLIVADIDHDGTKLVNDIINSKKTSNKLDVLKNADKFKDSDGFYRIGSITCVNNVSTGDINVIREAAIVKYFNESNNRYKEFMSGELEEEYLNNFLNFTIGEESLNVLKNNKDNVKIYKHQAKQLNKLYSGDNYIALYNKHIIDFVKKSLQLHIFDDIKYNIRLDKIDTTDIVILNLNNKELMQQLYNVYNNISTYEDIINVLKTNDNKQDYIGVSLKESNTQRLGTGYSFYETIENYNYWKHWELNTTEWITKDNIYSKKYIDKYLVGDTFKYYNGNIIRYYMNNRNVNKSIEIDGISLDVLSFYKYCMINFFKIINSICKELNYEHMDYLMSDDINAYIDNILKSDIDVYRLKHNVSTIEAICTTLLYDRLNILNEPDLYVAISKYCAGSLFKNDLYDNIFVKNGVVKEYPQFFKSDKSNNIIINTNGLKQTKGITVPMNIEIEDVYYGTCFLESISSGNKLMLKAKK